MTRASDVFLHHAVQVGTFKNESRSAPLGARSRQALSSRVMNLVTGIDMTSGGEVTHKHMG